MFAALVLSLLELAPPPGCTQVSKGLLSDLKAAGAAGDKMGRNLCFERLNADGNCRKGAEYVRCCKRDCIVLARSLQISLGEFFKTWNMRA